MQFLPMAIVGISKTVLQNMAAELPGTVNPEVAVNCITWNSVPSLEL